MPFIVKEETTTKRAKKSEASSYNPAARGCDACGLKEEWPQLTSPKLSLCGAIDGDILALGEGPGFEEDRQGDVFIGESGQFLRNHLPRRFVDRIAFTNTVRCRPPKNRNPTPQEIHACSVFFDADILDHDFKAILGVGSVPLSKFVDTPISFIRGTKFPVQIGDKVLWYFPIFHPAFVLRKGRDRSAEYPVFAEDLRIFFKEVDKWKPARIEHASPQSVISVFTEEEARVLLGKMKPPLAVDIETTKLRPYERDALILTAAFSDGNTTFAFPVEHPGGRTDWGLRFLLEVTSDTPWIAHNAAFELSWFLFFAKKYNIPWKVGTIEDSMALGRIYHQRERLLNLGILSRIHLGVNVKKLTDVNASQIMSYTLDEILPYNGLDAWASARIFQILRDQVDDYNYNHIIGAVKSTTHMELMGLPISLDAANHLKSEWTHVAGEQTKAAKTLYEVRCFEKDRRIEFNIGSNDHVAAALTEYGKIKLPKTKTGKLSTDDEVLLKDAAENPLTAIVLHFREARKHESTYIDPILNVPNLYEDGNLHPTYSTMLTATLRHSSSGPNIQNFPKRKHREFRRVITAPPGHVIVAFDYGQLEARIYAMATKDKELCDSFINKEDIHRRWLNRVLELYPAYIERLAEKVNETEEDKILEKGRDIIKTDFVFATFYGSLPETTANHTGIPFPITRQLTSEFWDLYAGANKWVKARRHEYQDTGKTRTLTGRVRFDVMGGNECINTPIQGTGADIVIDAQNELSETAFAMDDMYLHPRINVHDDLTMILPAQENKLDEYILHITQVMTKVRHQFQCVPLMVDAKIGDNWADMEFIGQFAGDYLR